MVELVDGGSPLSANVARYVLRLVQAGGQGEGAFASAPPAHDKPAAVRRPRDEPPNLTEREVDVLELLAKGFSPGEIGELLQISRHTVIAHSRNIHRKLEVSSRAEAIYEALSLGLITVKK